MINGHGADPRTARLQPNGTLDAMQSMHSTPLNSFTEDPDFGSDASSEASENVVVSVPREESPEVTIVWKDLQVSTRNKFAQKRQLLLKTVSGYAEPRNILAIVGPPGSGKSALVAALSGRLYKPAKLHGHVMISGREAYEAYKPTWFSAADVLTSHLTVHQYLTYKGQLQMPFSNRQAVEDVVHKVSQRLGLVPYLHCFTHQLSPGMQRRVTVACKFMNCGQLLILHGAVFGVNEGDGLAIMKALHDLCREGCTAIVEVEQASTDICTFFNQAYVLSAGQVVYFGDSHDQARAVLNGSGMPCPPLYHPVEQFMRLIDPSFEVYLQVGAGEADSWNAQFSSMMTKMLQDTYRASGMQAQHDSQVQALLQQAAPKAPPPKSGRKFFRRTSITVRRAYSQAARCFSLFQARVVLGVLIALAYGGTYSNLPYSFQGLQERSSLLFIVAAVLPLLTLGSLPVSAHNDKVFIQEHKACEVSLTTHMMTLILTGLPYLLLLPCLVAIVLIPLSNLNNSGSGWGYFILNVYLLLSVADAVVGTLGAIFTMCSRSWRSAVTGMVFVTQILAMGYFAGDQRGLNLAVGAISYNAYSFKGLLRNELQQGRVWGCPQSQFQLAAQGPCSLTDGQAYEGLSHNFGIVLSSKWDGIYALLGIVFIWRCLHAAVLYMRVRLFW